MISFRRNIRCSPDPSLHRQCSVLRDQAGSVLDHAGGEVRGVQGSGEGPLPRYWPEGCGVLGQDRLHGIDQSDPVWRRLCLHRSHLPAGGIPGGVCRPPPLPLCLDGDCFCSANSSHLARNSERLLVDRSGSPGVHHGGLLADCHQLHPDRTGDPTQDLSNPDSSGIFQRFLIV